MSDRLDPLDEESFDVTLRSTRALAERLAALGVLLSRVGLETTSHDEDDDEDEARDDPETERLELLAWLRDINLLGALSPSELQLVQSPVGALEEEVVAESSWQAERLAALAWAARLLDRLPPFHEQTDLSSVLAALPSPWDDLASFEKRIELRSEDEVGLELERCDVWLWRAETEMARHLAKRSELPEIALAIAEVVAESSEIGIVEKAPGGDFLVGSESFHRISEETRSMIETVAAERLRALNWLRGADDDWDGLSTDL